MPPRRAARSASRKSTPVSPPKSAKASTQSPQPTRRSTRTKTRDDDFDPRQPARRELQNVEEDEEESEVVVVDNTKIASQSVDEDGSSSESFSQSAEDESSSDSHADEDALDRDLLIDNFSNLYRDSQNVLQHFIGLDAGSVPPFLLTMRDTTSKTSKRVITSIRRFNVSREAFGGWLYIKPGIVARKLISVVENETLNEGQWRPDLILYLANLAQFVASLSFNGYEQVQQTLSFMFNSFPDLFCSPLGLTDHFATQYINETFMLGLELRTQFFIRACREQKERSGFDPDIILREIFIDEYNHLFAPELKPSTKQYFATMAQKRITGIREFITTDSREPVHLGDLQNKYPYDDFVSGLIMWAKLRGSEIEQEIAVQGGIDEIVDRIQEGNFAAEDPVKQADNDKAVLEDPAASAPIPTSTGNLDEPTKPSSELFTGTPLEKNIARLKDLKAQSAARRSGASIPSQPLTKDTEPAPEASATVPGKEPDKYIEEYAPVMGDDDEQSLENNDELPIPRQVNPPSPSVRSPRNRMIPTQETRYVLDVLSSQAVQSNKENQNPKSKRSFMDSQANAERLVFDSEDEASTSPAKRRREQESEDSAEESQFEEDKRSPKKLRVDKGKGRAPGRPTLSNKPAIDDDIEDEDEFEDREPEMHQTLLRKKQVPSTQRSPPPGHQAIPSTQPTRSVLQPRSSHLPSSTAPVPVSHRSTPSSVPSSSQPPPSTATAQAIADVNRAAKQTVRRTHYTQGIPQGQRKAYSEDEIDRLVCLIATRGTGWAAMLEADRDPREFPEGPRLQNRSQVQLKDKARNIKLDYLKAGMPLPPNFYQVSIGKRQIEILEGLGIRYEEGWEEATRI